MSVKKTYCEVRINGEDISSSLMPRLISLSIMDKAGSSSDTVSIELDDADGVILLPSEGAQIDVLLGANDSGGTIAFRGVIDEVRSSGSRSGGRTLSVSGKGFDAQGKAKEPQQKHWDDKKLGDVMSEAGELAGIKTVKVDRELASITRKYWAMQGESFIHFGERIAREIGGTFKIANDTAIIAKRNGGKSASGAELATVRAAYGDNLISWEIAPVLGRPRYKKAKARWYDKKAGVWKTEEVEIVDEKAKAEFTERYDAADQDEAKQHVESRKADSERGKGGGSVTIDGTAAAQPEGTLILSGARPGIDGTYRIDTVNQEYSRSGWTTRLDLQQPQGEAGKDSRKGKKPSTRKKKGSVASRDLGDYSTPYTP